MDMTLENQKDSHRLSRFRDEAPAGEHEYYVQLFDAADRFTAALSPAVSRPLIANVRFRPEYSAS